MGTLSKDVDWYSVVRSVLNDALIREGKAITGLDLNQNEWKYMDINDSHSPRMMQISKKGEAQKILVYYPEHSTPYKDKFVDKYKLAQIWDGEIYDEVSGKKYVKDDIIEVCPMDKFSPVTKDHECYVIVEVRDKRSEHEGIKEFIYRNCK